MLLSQAVAKLASYALRVVVSRDDTRMIFMVLFFLMPKFFTCSISFLLLLVVLIYHRQYGIGLPKIMILGC